MSVTIVVTVDDEELTEGAVHEAVILAIELAGFKRWASYVAREPDHVPPPRIPPGTWPERD